MQTYNTVKGFDQDEFIEKRSRFIGYIKHVETEKEATDFIAEIRAKHWDATHNVYAYVLRENQTMRYSDDNEPQGTAGIPVLDVLKKSNVTDVVVVVTRYFGGVLLGGGGLVRAYSHTARLALDAAHIITYEQYTELELICSYSDYQKYQAELPRFGAVVDDTQFTDRVTLLFSVKDPVVEDVLARVREISNGNTVPTVRGKRFDYR